MLTKGVHIQNMPLLQHNYISIPKYESINMLTYAPCHGNGIGDIYITIVGIKKVINIKR